MNFKVYSVGGCVRDEIIGRPCKDLDFVVMAPSFEAMASAIKDEGGEIFVEKKQFGTIRAKHPKYGVADFALPRLDGVYSDGRRPDSVTFVDSIVADLGRRDSTMNAIAKDMETGELIDPFNGMVDITRGVVRAVGDPEARIKEDALRALRYIRQSKQLKFTIETDLLSYICSMFASHFASVSTERILDELTKILKTNQSMVHVIHYYSWLPCLMQERGIWLKPTVEKI